MNKFLDLLIGTNIETGKKYLNGNFNELVFLSDNLETAEHYNQGCILKITFKINTNDEMMYIRNIEELGEIGDKFRDNYTYGSAVTKIPKGATWYSVSGKYLADNLISVTNLSSEHIVVDHYQIITKLASEFPFSIHTVTNIYINNGMNEKITRKLLSERLIIGRD